MRNLTFHALVITTCLIGLTACANRPAAYCPYPPIPGNGLVGQLKRSDAAEGSTEGGDFLNRYRKHLCKYWQQYEPETYKRECQ